MASYLDDALLHLDDDVQLKDVEDLDMAEEEALLGFSEDESDLLDSGYGNGNVQATMGEKIPVVNSYANDSTDQDVLDIHVDAELDSFSQDTKESPNVRRDSLHNKRASVADDEDDDEESNERRARFRSERFSVASLAANKKRLYIPDTLDAVVVEEEVAKANQFLTQQREQKMRGRGNNRRGRGGSNWQQGRRNQPMGNRPQPKKEWQNRNQQNFHQPQFPHQFHQDSQIRLPPPQLDSPVANNTGRKILINPHFRGVSFPQLEQHHDAGFPRNNFEFGAPPQPIDLRPQHHASGYAEQQDYQCYHQREQQQFVPNVDECLPNFGHPIQQQPLPYPVHHHHQQQQAIPFENYHQPQQPPVPQFHQMDVPRGHDMRSPVDHFQPLRSENWAHHQIPPQHVTPPLPPQGGHFQDGAPPRLPPQHQHQQPYQPQHNIPPQPPHHSYQDTPPPNLGVPPPGHVQQQLYNQQPHYGPPQHNQFAPQHGMEYGHRPDRQEYHNIEQHPQQNIRHNLPMHANRIPPQQMGGNNMHYGGQNFGQRRQKRQQENMANHSPIKQIRMQKKNMKQQQQLHKSTVDMTNIKEIPLVENLPQLASKEVLPPEDEDEETRQLRLKIEEQKKLREEIMRKKEERRRQMAAQRLQAMQKAESAPALSTPLLTAIVSSVAPVTEVQPKPPVKQRLGQEPLLAQKKVLTLRKAPIQQQVVATGAAKALLQPQNNPKVVPQKVSPPQAEQKVLVQQQPTPKVQPQSQKMFQQSPTIGTPPVRQQRPKVPAQLPIRPNLGGSSRTVLLQRSLRPQHFPQNSPQLMPRGPQLMPRGPHFQRTPQMMMRPQRFPQPQQMMATRPPLQRPGIRNVPLSARPVMRAAAPVAPARVVLPPADPKGRIVKLAAPAKPQTQTVIVKNLSVSTTEKQLSVLSRSVGPIESVTIDRKNQCATIKFKLASHAAQFQNKFQRYMLDLSMIQVSLVE